jgi:DNA-binding transcriptional LysR family regulator
MAATDPLSIRQLEVFVALTEQGSFTRAARSLELSQSTVSGHVADLERRLGVRVKPTAAGAALLPPAREVLQAERSARMAVEELSGLLRGTLLVGGSTIPASYLLPGLFARFHQQHPGISLQLVTGDSREVIEAIGNATAEVGIVGAAPRNTDLLATKVGQDSLVLIMAPGHPLASRKGISKSDLLEGPMVMREQGSGTRSATDAALTELLGSELGRLHVACEVGSTEAMKGAVRSGLGAAFVSDLAVKEELASGALVSRPVTGFSVSRDFFMVSKGEAGLSPAARAFRAAVLADAP